MRRHAIVATMLVASVLAQALAKDSVDWAVNATIIDGCSCRMLCPCIFGFHPPRRLSCDPRA